MKTIRILYVPVYRQGNIEEPVCSFAFTDLQSCKNYIDSLPNPKDVYPKDFMVIHDPAEPVDYSTSHVNSSGLAGYYNVITLMEKVAQDSSSMEEYHLKLLTKLKDAMVATQRTFDIELQELLKSSHMMP